MMPPTTSPFPSSSATPRRISGPRRTWATSRTRIGVPWASAPLGQIVLAAFVNERVFEYPADAGRVGADHWIDTFRKLSAEALEVLDNATPRPVHVGAVCEDHVHVRDAKIGEPAHGFDARR